MRIMITGVTGFAGGFLADALLQQAEAQIAGVGREDQWPATTRHLAGRVELHGLDLCDGARIEALLRQFQPEQIYHLAGYAHVGRSFREPQSAWAGNLNATLTLYDAVHRWEASREFFTWAVGKSTGSRNIPIRPSRRVARSARAVPMPPARPLPIWPAFNMPARRGWTLFGFGRSITLGHGNPQSLPCRTSPNRLPILSGSAARRSWKPAISVHYAI